MILQRHERRGGYSGIRPGLDEGAEACGFTPEAVGKARAWGTQGRPGSRGYADGAQLRGSQWVVAQSGWHLEGWLWSLEKGLQPPEERGLWPWEGLRERHQEV